MHPGADEIAVAREVRVERQVRARDADGVEPEAPRLFVDLRACVGDHVETPIKIAESRLFHERSARFHDALAGLDGS
ncbi:MAG TPA: hypothetical protein VIF62_15580, partial [Labilithrix sp.]